MNENIVDENVNGDHVDSKKEEGKTLESHNEQAEVKDMTGNHDEERASRFQEFFSEAVETDNPKVTGTLLTFLELKYIDAELSDISEEKGDLPETIDNIKSKLEFLRSDMNGKMQSVSGLEEEKIKIESENNSFETKINKYDEQKFNVRSNKEYDEIVKTIDTLFEEVEKNESRVKDISESSETFKSEIEVLDNKINELQTDLNEKQTLLDELNEQYRQEEFVLNDKRSKLMSKINVYSASFYERINGMYKGEATAIVRKGNCSGCYNSIPPQRVIEIKMAEKIFTCQSCGRILIAEELLSPPK